MGVPALFKTLTKTFPHILESTECVENIDILAFDYNCLIHHCKNEINENLASLSNIRNQEEHLIIEIIRYTLEIIDLIDPNTVYISIDGTVPYSKMRQQRKRRYKKEGDTGFDSNKISPGTAFMSKLSGRIKNVMTIGFQRSKKIKCIFSDCNVPGEGESKIMSYISSITKPQNVVIYGLDADLIILSTLQKHKIKLLREAKVEDTNVPFLLMNINLLKKHMLNFYEIDVSVNADNFFKDFACLSCLGGNDFVEPLSFCKIRDGGLKHIMYAYKSVCLNNNIHLVKNNKVDIPVLLHIIKFLAPYEEEKLNAIYHRIYHNREPLTTDNKDHLYFTNPSHPDYAKYKPIFDKLNFCKPLSWWNSYYFHDSCISSVCSDYILSIQWCLHYYIYNKPSNWFWYYPYEAAPLISDLVNFDIKDVSFLSPSEKEEYIYPLEQLFYILPPHSSSLLPKNYQSFILSYKSPIYKFFEKNPPINVVKGHKNIYSEPSFSSEILDARPSILSILSKCPITSYELTRNSIRSEPFFKFA